MELIAGAQISEKLRLVRELGKGGMGSVWVADHLSLERQVAVKFISADELKEPLARERFEQEAKAAAKLDNPHVVHIYDQGFTAEATPYIVMELLRGESLGQRLKRGRLEVSQVAEVIGQTAKALTAAHREGIVHRDIKPDNIFLQELDDELFVKVLDFGVAKLTKAPEVQAVTVTGTVVGTPEYMSPEQLLGAKNIDFRADLWALAVVAYRSLTGALPFSGDSLIGLCLTITKGSPPSPSTLVAELGTHFDAWFARALARDIEARFASAKQLASSFTDLCAGVNDQAMATVGEAEGVSAPTARQGSGLVPDEYAGSDPAWAQGAPAVDRVGSKLAAENVSRDPAEDGSETAATAVCGASEHERQVGSAGAVAAQTPPASTRFAKSGSSEVSSEQVEPPVGPAKRASDASERRGREFAEPSAIKDDERVESRPSLEIESVSESDPAPAKSRGPRVAALVFVVLAALVGVYAIGRLGGKGPTEPRSNARSLPSKQNTAAAFTPSGSPNSDPSAVPNAATSSATASDPVAAAQTSRGQDSPAGGQPTDYTPPHTNRPTATATATASATTNTTASSAKPKKGGSSAAALRGAILACWPRTEGGQPGQAAVQARFWVTTDDQGKPLTFGMAAPAPKFRACARGVMQSFHYYPNENINVSLTLPANESK